MGGDDQFNLDIQHHVAGRISRMELSGYRKSQVLTRRKQIFKITSIHTQRKDFRGSNGSEILYSQTSN